MEFFLDTADITCIKELLPLGIIDGITTNPTLIKKSGKSHEWTIRSISELVNGPISVETIGETSDSIIKEAETYLSWGDDIVIKIVLSHEGIKAVSELSKRGIQTNVTLCFSPLQALIAAKAGATYVSPFVGRLDDAGHDGMSIVEEICDIFSEYQAPTRVLVASIRSPKHVLDAALVGADIATVPPSVLLSCFKHPLTDKGIEIFKKDAEQWKK